MKYVSSKQMSEVDNLAVGKYGLDILQMMENAGRNLADFVSVLNPHKVVLFFGKGNNGGGGLVAVRHLAIRGISVEMISASKKLNAVPRRQLKILKVMGLKEQKNVKLHKGDVLIDALLGYNVKGNPRGRYSDLINSINFMKSQGIIVVSLDLPSGLDPDGLLNYTPCVEADYILTLALPKIGLKKIAEKSKRNVNLVNIGIPNELYKDLDIDIKNYFNKKDVVEI